MALRAWSSSIGSPPFGTGDAGDWGPVTAYSTANTASGACIPTNQDCTWTVTQGMILNDEDSTLGLNEVGGNSSNPPLEVTSACLSNNPDCRWQISSSGISIEDGGKLITYSRNNSYGFLSLSNQCTGPGCSAMGTSFSMTIAAD